MTVQGRHIAITGPTAGIGRSCALQLAARGASLVLFCRNAEKGDELAREIVATSGLRPEIVIMNMADLDSVRRAAEQCLALEQPLDILLNNAGVVNTERRVTTDDYEETLAVNHLAPFLLTGLLLPRMAQSRAARIVNVASDAHRFVSGMGFDDMQAERGYKTFREYGRSKGANVLFTRSLAKRLADTTITVNCLHPGAVATSLGTQNEGFFSHWLPALLKPFFRSPDRGAETSIYLCESDAVVDVSGRYFSNCKQVKPKSWVLDDATAEQLWAFSETATDFRYP
ncbi:alcohol dehydrogenase [Halioglobus japonicus]|uniref:KR domain-containing protein n=1 Tax=Halioglobus japonicus TaxID=930805 RepID=A0AAP8MCS2_9GAMM|nr:SDR family oxidoreductase [Halioglobus japonicus]AQA20099.1 alcohol dehydrogenase [Halioglobus japonicus]PLW85204.1 KR domain-containing protein [Halioglobus japonicus]GHD19054.1 short-chain dehydrogenase [Halioglobus japonicus]